jgi:hypothetical protein
MGIPQKIMVDAATAAKMMDMSIEDFRGLVEIDVLPPARMLGSLERWSVDDLRAIATGEALDNGRMSW